MGLTALQVKNAKQGDKLGDGGGLRLDVDRNGNRSWIFRYTSPVTSKERFMGLGPLRDVSLAQARDAAGDARALVRDRKKVGSLTRKTRDIAEAAAASGETPLEYMLRVMRDPTVDDAKRADMAKSAAP
jgi:hypothetical protein